MRQPSSFMRIPITLKMKAPDVYETEADYFMNVDHQWHFTETVEVNLRSSKLLKTTLGLLEWYI